MSALDEFRALKLPSAEDAFRLGAQVCPRCRVAKSHKGLLAIAIEVEPTGSSTARRLQHLTYDPPRTLEVHAADGTIRKEVLALLVCRSSEQGLQRVFLRMAVALFDDPGKPLTEAEVERRLEELVGLLRAMQRPAEQTIQGLWCELAVIVWSANPGKALSAWHSNARALYDFEALPYRLEVKSASTELREHSIRLEQLMDAPDGRTLLASFVVASAGDGATIFDLCETIVTRLGGSTEAKRRLETVVTRSLGQEWREAETQGYDLDAARRALRVYEARNVPSVSMPVPPEVKRVHFVVDLSGVNDMSLAEARAIAPFFAELLPADR